VHRPDRHLFTTFGLSMAQLQALTFILANERDPTIAEMETLQEETLRFIREPFAGQKSAEPMEWRYLRRALLRCLSHCQNRLGSVND